MNRIDLFMPPLSNYGVLHYFTKKMYEALVENGINCRLLEAKRTDPKPFLQALFENPPDCTLSFNGLLPDDQGRFFCDLIRTPHVACLVDSPYSFLPLTQSAYSIVTSIDRSAVEFFQGLGFSNALFLPHAVDKSLFSENRNKREYDVVMLSSCIDYEGLRASWKRKFSAPLRKAMEETIDLALSNPELPYYHAFVEVLDKEIKKQSDIDPQKINFVGILDEIEMYIRGKDRVELVRAISDAKVSIFGSADGPKGWKKYLGNQRNVKIHDPVPFQQALEIMKHAKIVLNSSPWIKYGGHERLFSGLALGALVITSENAFLRENFQDGNSIVFYQSLHWDKANHRVNEYLENHGKREQIVKNGSELVMKNHTWDQRALKLVKELPKILEKIKQKVGSE